MGAAIGGVLDRSVQPIGAPVSDLDPYSIEFLTDPFSFLSTLRDMAPVVFLERYGVWAVSRHEWCEFVLRDFETFSSAAGAGMANLNREEAWRKPSNILEVDPPVHTTNRRVLSRALAPPSLRSLQERFDRRAQRLADDLAARGRFDAITDLAEVFPTQVFPEAFGLRDDGKDKLLAYASMVFNGQGPRNERFEEALASGAEVIGWITAQCARSSLRPDGLGAHIYEAVDAGEISEEEAALLVRGFLSAGIDTTVSAIGLGVLAFIRHPDQWELLRQDPSLARNAFEEVVRLEAPVIGFFRTTTSATAIGGVPLPADAKVLVFFAGANRDERRWDNPDRFDIRRKTSGHLGFGTGVHNCIGQGIARMEGETLFRALANNVQSWALAGEPEVRLNNSLRGLKRLPVEIISA